MVRFTRIIVCYTFVVFVIYDLFFLPTAFAKTDFCNVSFLPAVGNSFSVNLYADFVRISVLSELKFKKHRTTLIIDEASALDKQKKK